MLDSTQHEISMAQKNLMNAEIIDSSCFKPSDVVFIMQINVKMPTIVGFLTFMSRINFMR